MFNALVLGILIDMKHVDIRESIYRYRIVLYVILYTLRLLVINYILNFKKGVKFLLLIRIFYSF